MTNSIIENVIAITGKTTDVLVVVRNRGSKDSLFWEDSLFSLLEKISREDRETALFFQRKCFSPTTPGTKKWSMITLTDTAAQLTKTSGSVLKHLLCTVSGLHFQLGKTQLADSARKHAYIHTAPKSIPSHFPGRMPSAHASCWL